MSLRNALLCVSAVTLVATSFAPPAFGATQIIRPFQSVRSSGMGGVRYTTGLYEENFFGNPARSTANPRGRVTLLDPMIEFSSSTLSTVDNLIGSGSNKVQEVAAHAGENNHARVQTTMPSFYWSPGKSGKWALGAGLITSIQSDLNLRQSFNLDPLVVLDIGPAVTVARKLLNDNELSVGATAHLVYRLSTNSSYSVLDFIRGAQLAPGKSGGQGALFDFDMGATYQFHWHPLGLNLHAAAAINNLLGGKYTLGFKPIQGVPNKPTEQPRTFNLGASATLPSQGIFKRSTVAFEVTDIGNNSNGSLFRTLHTGVESWIWNLLALRLGLNQGYIAAGVGVDLRFISFDFATYGEELSLNAGGMEDRRYAFRLGLHI